MPTNPFYPKALPSSPKTNKNNRTGVYLDGDPLQIDN